MIDKILTLSTSNITEKDVSLLEKEKNFSIGDFGFGLFMFTYKSMSDEEFFEWCPKEYSNAFKKIMKYARKNNCRYICFDCDADVLENFETFDW